MDYEWDERKRQSNLTKHGIDFMDVHRVFDVPHVTLPAGNTTEPRSKTIGPLDDRLATIIFTIRGDAIRVISARRARKNERRDYQAIYPGPDTADEGSDRLGSPSPGGGGWH